jgi:hypothetical protein
MQSCDNAAKSMQLNVTLFYAVQHYFPVKHRTLTVGRIKNQQAHTHTHTHTQSILRCSQKSATNTKGAQQMW